MGENINLGQYPGQNTVRQIYIEKVIYPEEAKYIRMAMIDDSWLERMTNGENMGCELEGIIADIASDYKLSTPQVDYLLTMCENNATDNKADDY